MKKLLEKIKSYKYFKDFKILIGAVSIGLTAVLGQWFSETSDKPFWWTFWDIATAASIAVWVGVWVILERKDRNK